MKNNYSTVLSDFQKTAGKILKVSSATALVIAAAPFVGQGLGSLIPGQDQYYNVNIAPSGQDLHIKRLEDGAHPVNLTDPTVGDAFKDAWLGAAFGDAKREKIAIEEFKIAVGLTDTVVPMQLAGPR